MDRPYCYRKKEKEVEEERLQCIPSVYILGFRKCGATELAAKLALHPQVVPPNMKEIHFWDHQKIRVGHFSFSSPLPSLFHSSLPLSLFPRSVPLLCLLLLLLHILPVFLHLIYLLQSHLDHCYNYNLQMQQQPFYSNTKTQTKLQNFTLSPHSLSFNLCWILFFVCFL
jgi:hypothetical protein